MPNFTFPDACGVILLGSLGLNREKTRIVPCKGGKKDKGKPSPSFDFLGYIFRPRVAKGPKGECFVGFLPAISDKAKKKIRGNIKSWRIHRRIELTLEEVSKRVNPKVRG